MIPGSLLTGLSPSLRHPSTWRVDLASLRVPPHPVPAGRFGQGEMYNLCRSESRRDEEPEPKLKQF